MTPSEERRAQMIRTHLVARGIKDRDVLRAMANVPREAFVPGDLVEFAYDDSPLPIAEGQTISQPYVVADMIEAARVTPGSRVLEIGAGSGYAAAVLSRIAAAVYAVERNEVLAWSAARRLADLGYENVHVLCADGTLGWKRHAPFDAIIVSAGAPSVPRALSEQLAEGGMLVIPVGATPEGQRLLRITRTGPSEYSEEDLGAVQFVPLIGSQGWADGIGAIESAPIPRVSHRMTPFR